MAAGELSPATFARLIGRHPKTVRGWCASGKVRCRVVGSKPPRYWIPRSEINLFGAKERGKWREGQRAKRPPKGRQNA